MESNSNDVVRGSSSRDAAYYETAASGGTPVSRTENVVPLSTRRVETREAGTGHLLRQENQTASLRKAAETSALAAAGGQRSEAAARTGSSIQRRDDRAIEGSTDLSFQDSILLKKAMFHRQEGLEARASGKYSVAQESVESSLRDFHALAGEHKAAHEAYIWGLEKLLVDLKVLQGKWEEARKDTLDLIAVADAFVKDRRTAAPDVRGEILETHKASLTLRLGIMAYFNCRRLKLVQGTQGQESVEEKPGLEQARNYAWDVMEMTGRKADEGNEPFLQLKQDAIFLISHALEDQGNAADARFYRSLLPDDFRPCGELKDLFAELENLTTADPPNSDLPNQISSSPSNAALKPATSLWAPTDALPDLERSLKEELIGYITLHYYYPCDECFDAGYEGHCHQATYQDKVTGEMTRSCSRCQRLRQTCTLTTNMLKTLVTAPPGRLRKRFRLITERAPALKWPRGEVVRISGLDELDLTSCYLISNRAAGRDRILVARENHIDIGVSLEHDDIDSSLSARQMFYFGEASLGSGYGDDVNGDVVYGGSVYGGSVYGGTSYYGGTKSEKKYAIRVLWLRGLRWALHYNVPTSTFAKIRRNAGTELSMKYESDNTVSLPDASLWYIRLKKDGYFRFCNAAKEKCLRTQGNAFDVCFEQMPEGASNLQAFDWLLRKVPPLPHIPEA